MTRTASIFSFFILLLSSFYSHAQNIDVLHYKYEIELSDASDAITVKATIRLRFLQEASVVRLDLASLEEEKGMAPFRASVSGMPLRFASKSDKLTLWLRQTAAKGTEQTFEVEYMGVPKDGLIISKNKWGDRTFFADNWPDRAKNWLLSNDRPDDKASVEFVVTAPVHYKVISNGLLQSEKEVGNKKITHWKEPTPIPTKVMILGAARFAVKEYGSKVAGVPVSAWVYPQDSTKGFHDYGLADSILYFFQNYIAPFPYKKLANVQSKTIFGGMENASAIFYGEETVTGNRESEALLAHEIAHQWFGNTATEKSFSHLWLSEGFATYLTNIYIQSKYGVDSFRKRLKAERNEIIQFAKTSRQAIVDSTSEYMDLLNANSYQKGGWVLHMLRSQLGDSVFKKIIQVYYHQYKGGNADSKDFENVAEQVSGKDLSKFFGQWLYQPGIPQLKFTQKSEGDDLVFIVEQLQPGDVYELELEVIIDEDVDRMMITVPIVGRTTEHRLKGRAKSKDITIDPQQTTLFEEVK